MRRHWIVATAQAHPIPVPAALRRAGIPAYIFPSALRLGLPVVLKIDSPDIVHKTDVGGVTLDIRTADDVRAAFTEMIERVSERMPDARIDGVVVERYLSGGRETIVGMGQDRRSGTLSCSVSAVSMSRQSRMSHSVSSRCRTSMRTKWCDRSGATACESPA